MIIDALAQVRMIVLDELRWAAATLFASFG
jgi:hypothetical protein